MTDDQFREILAVLGQLWPKQLGDLNAEQENVWWSVFAIADGRPTVCIPLIRDHAARSKFAPRPAEIREMLIRIGAGKLEGSDEPTTIEILEARLEAAARISDGEYCIHAQTIMAADPILLQYGIQKLGRGWMGSPPDWEHPLRELDLLNQMIGDRVLCGIGPDYPTVLHKRGDVVQVEPDDLERAGRLLDEADRIGKLRYQNQESEAG